MRGQMFLGLAILTGLSKCGMGYHCQSVGLQVFPALRGV